MRGHEARSPMFHARHVANACMLGESSLGEVGASVLAIRRTSKEGRRSSKDGKRGSARLETLSAFAGDGRLGVLKLLQTPNSRKGPQGCFPIGELCVRR